MRKLLVTGKPLAERFAKTLGEMGFEVTNGSSAVLQDLGASDTERELTEDEIRDVLPGYEVYVYGGLEPASRTVLTSAGDLRLIAFMGTAWADPGCVDADAAAQQHVRVTNTPHANAPSVAEFAVGLAIGLARYQYAMATETTEHKMWHPLQGTDISGKRVGIVGMGAIGTLVSKHLYHGFGTPISYFSRSARPDIEAEINAVRVPDPAHLFRDCEIVSLHAPMSDETHGLISHGSLSAGTDRILVNTASPELVDASALIQAMEKGEVRSVALDGKFPDEELNDRLLAFGAERFVQFPRAAWLAQESYDRIAGMVCNSVAAYVDGVDIPNLVLGD